MHEIIKSVEEFHRTYNVPIGDPVSIPYRPIYELRHTLMAEENDEYLEACLKNDPVEMADALGDMLYILTGTMITHGMQDKIVDVFNEIHRSNMSKLGEDGKPIYRESDRKVLKGPNYTPPDIRKILYGSGS